MGLISLARPRFRNLWRNSLLYSKTQGIPFRALSVNVKPGDKLPYGWTVEKNVAIPELSLSAVLHLRHDYCGAQMIHMSNPSDETNAFSVCFKTIPMNSTGVPHILEHVTTCGSQKYPVRDPFFKMLNRSFATFMNAMTGPDYTMYPFATQNKKDFYNLMSVYLDMVFKPLIKETDFNQEGWRLSEENGKLMIKGVVFNEMKGVFGDSQTIFGEALLNTVLPSHTYGQVSGGLPEKIPDLTYRELKEFYNVHYSPDNAKFYSYGNLDLEDHLKEISYYLPEEKQSSLGSKVSTVPSEPRWASPRRQHIKCPDDGSSTSNTLAVAFLVSDINNVYENFVIKVLTELLIDGPNAPFYQNLIESGLGSAFSPSSGFETSTRDSIFSIGLQGISMDQCEIIEQTIEKTFNDAHQSGFPEERLEAILHKMELGLKKQVNNFGLNLIFGLSPTWNHVEDPLEHLQVNEILNRFKKDIENKDFLRDKVREYFIDNHHKLVLTMSPDPKFVDEREEVLKDVENRLIKSLSEAEKSKVLQMDQALKLEQAAKEDEKLLDCLPSLKIEDIPLKKPRYAVKKSCFGQTCVQPTNGVSYFRALLSTADIEMHPVYSQYLPIFSMILTQVGAGEKYDYRKFDTVMDLYTGGLSASNHLAESPENLNDLRLRGLFLSSFCLDRNSEKMLDLWKEIFLGAFKPGGNNTLESLTGRVSNLITMSAVDAINGVAHSGHHYAMMHAASKLENLPAQMVRERQSGLSMVRFLTSISKSIEETSTEIFPILSGMADLILKQENLRGIALNVGEDHVENLAQQTDKFVNSLPMSMSGEERNQTSSSGGQQSSRKTYVSSAFPVHYSGLAIPTVPYAHDDSAPLRILAKLLTSKFLLPEVREKGGAYGAGASASPSSGTFTFYSYRDPNLQSTVEAFEKCAEWVSNSDNFTERDIIEAKLGVFQAIDRPVLPGQRGLGEFLSGISDEKSEAHRHKLLHVDRKSLEQVAEKYLGHLSAGGLTVIGPESNASSLDSSWEVQKLSEG